MTNRPIDPIDQQTGQGCKKLPPPHPGVNIIKLSGKKIKWGRMKGEGKRNEGKGKGSGKKRRGKKARGREEGRNGREWKEKVKGRQEGIEGKGKREVKSS